MSKKIIVAIIIILIIAAGVSIYFVLQEPTEKCGDGVCGTVEKEKGTCPEDCEEQTTPAILESFLVKVNTYDMTPKTSEPLRSWRPEIQKIGDKFYYAFNKGEKFALVILDENFVPPTVPLFVPIVGSFMAISIAKHAFGTRSHIFNPALAGRAFLVAAWPVLMSTWITPDGVTGATPLGALKMTGEKIASYSQLFFGNIGGAIGETSALALLIGAVFLFFMKVIDWKIPLAYVGTVFILTFAFGKDPLFHILAGGLMLGAFFMATDYVTTPITKNGRLIFGVGCGLLTVIIRLFSGLLEGVMYSILLMNAFTPLIDRYSRPKPFGFRLIKKEHI